MSSFYDDASLVVIPSGYKTSKVYAEKPTDGSGDLAFTRTGDTATRVNSAGLIEKVRTQLLDQTAFSNAYWTKRGFTLNSSTATAPDGTATATQVTENNTDANPAVAVITAPIYTNPTNFSVWIKASTATTINLSTQGALAGGSISVTTSWQKFSISQTFAIAFGPHIGGFSSIAQGSGLVLYLWQPMWEFGDVATDYFANSTGSPLSVGPVANVPRLDYLGSTCPRLLLEPQRTNLMTYSEQFNNANWFKYQSTITSNSTTSPDGYTNADTIADSAVNDVHIAYQNTAFTAGSYTVSCYAKANTLSHAFLQIYDGANFYASGIFNLTNGTVSGAGSITSAGNGWYRLSLTATVATGTGYSYVGTSNGSSVAYAGSGQSIYIWGYQTEASTYPTSYIPCLAASATRGADACSKTGISSLIGVNGGSIFVELDANGLNSGVANYIFDLSDGTNFDQNRIAMYWTSANDLNIFYAYGGTTASVTYTFNFLTTKKVAVRWTSTQIQVVVNGVAQTAVTYGNSSPTKLDIGSRFNAVEHLSSNAKQCLLFNTTLTAAQLATLTTL